MAFLSDALALVPVTEMMSTPERNLQPGHKHVFVRPGQESEHNAVQFPGCLKFS